MIRNTIRNTIQNTIRNTLGDDAFNMLNLFSGGQRGVWYDPSDLATMFQESTGTTAVTADGQPVGLVLDKSKGLELGAELIVNGTFDSDSDWNKDSNWTIESGKATSTGFGRIFQVLPFFENNIGTTAEVTFEITELTQGSVVVNLYGSVSEDFTSVGTHTFIARSIDNTNLYFNNAGAGGSGFIGSIDNVSVKEVLGNHASQPVATKRPTYKDTPDRLEIDLVDDALLFDVPTGGIDGYMVIGTNDGTASYGVSLPAGSYELGGDYFPSNTINGFLLREGAVSAADLSNVEKDFVSKGAKASYGDVADFSFYWRDKGITEFPLIDTSSGTNFRDAWRDNNLTSFPLLDTSNGTNFYFAWLGNNLTSFPLLDTSSGTIFYGAWFGNTSLEDFPANMFDNCLCTNFASAFTNTGLSQSSIDGILVSIESNGTSNGTFDQSGGSAPSATGEAAIDAMRSRGWTITVTGGY